MFSFSDASIYECLTFNVSSFHLSNLLFCKFSNFRYTARTVLPLESVVSVLACIMMAAGNPSNGMCPATYFYSSTSGLVGKWLYDHYLKLMNNCVR